MERGPSLMLQEQSKRKSGALLGHNTITKCGEAHNYGFCRKKSSLESKTCDSCCTVRYFIPLIMACCIRLCHLPQTITLFLLVCEPACTVGHGYLFPNWENGLKEEDNVGGTMIIHKITAGHWHAFSNTGGHAKVHPSNSGTVQSLCTPKSTVLAREAMIVLKPLLIFIETEVKLTLKGSI